MVQKLKSAYHTLFLRRRILVFAKLNKFSLFYNRFLNWLPYGVIVLFKRLTSSDEYLRIIQSQIFLIRANRDLAKNQNRRVIKDLKVALYLLGQDLSTEYKSFLISSYRQVLSDRNQHKNVSLEVTRATDAEINNGIKSCVDAYYYLSKFLNWCGFLNAGFLAREKSVLICRFQALHSQSLGRHVEMSCAANLECGDFDNAENVLRIHTLKFRPERLAHFNFYLNLLRSEETEFVNSGVKKFCDAEIQISRILKGKTVALIGTGTVLGEYGDEIDSCDLVVRVKYSGREYLPPKSHHGERCDISYYTSLSPLEMLFDNGESFDALDGLKFLLVAQFIEQREFRGIPILFLSNLRSIFPNGDLTTGLLCLANLLRFQPSSVKLFGFDFYAMPKIYNAEMVDFYRHEGWKIGDPILMSDIDENSFTERVQGHFWHDQIANFTFARNLFNAGVIKSEPVSAQILALTPQEYASHIETLLRASFLKSNI